MTDLMILEKLIHIDVRNISCETIIGSSASGELIRINEIKTLDLSDSGIEKIPEEIGYLEELQTLIVRNTPITYLPKNIWRLKNLQKLDASHTQLIDLPEKIAFLNNLRYLDVSETMITELPLRIGELRNLHSLDISGNNFSELTEKIGRLYNLRYLNISRTQISYLPLRIEELHRLESLNISRTRISNFPLVIVELQNLQKLNVSETLLSSIPQKIGKLSNLKVLNISGTQISELPLAVMGLQNLQELDVSRTLLKSLPHEIGELSNLKVLNINGTQISLLPDEIGKLHNLQKLDASRLNYISLTKSIWDLKKDVKAPPIIEANGNPSNYYFNKVDVVGDNNALSGLTSLTHLDLSESEIDNLSAISALTAIKSINLQRSKTAAIPVSVLDLNLCFITEETESDEWSKHQGIYIHGISLKDQPIEIFSLGDDLIRAYFYDKEKVPVNECKVIFLGDAESGKTYSIRRLLNHGKPLMDDVEESTPGIEITVSSIKIENTDIIVNYWDFGGQEIQHSMHRMFLTERTAYVVFLNARQDDLMDERAKYWLENIKTFAPEAPVLVVVNKIDQNNNPKFNERGIIESYDKQIKKVVRMSAKKDNKKTFLKNLKVSINEIIIKYLEVKKPIPLSWKSLMEDIRIMPDHYLTAEQFKLKCEKNKILNYRDYHDDLVELFRVIGVSFCYYKDRSIADYMLLNPKWMLNALYTIVANGKTVSQNGVIAQNDLYDLLKEDEINGRKIKRVLPNVRYENFEVAYILGVIRMFWLSYKFNDGEEFFPMLCEGDEKISVREAVPKEALHFIFRYTYLPTNVIHRIIVEMHRDLDYQYVWYSGAIFRNVLQNQSAYIHSLSNDLHVYVYGTEEYYSLNEYLTPICNAIRKINKDMRLSFEEFLTYRVSNKEFEFLYEEVEGNLRNNMYQRYDARIKGIIDYRDIARRFMNDGSKIDTILQLILNSLKKMQGNMVYYRNDKNGRGLEDDRNRFVSSCLTIAGYLCNDKQPQGVSNGGRASGECDFVVKNKKKQDVLIYEGLILRFMDRGYINTHIEKLLKNYNTSGLPKGVLVIYLECGRDRFKGFTENYREYISGYAPDLYECIGVPQIIPTEEEYLVCMEMYYEIGGLSFSIYHIIVRIAP